MRDLFGAPTNGHAYLKPVEDEFRWIVGVFSGDGAVEVIRRAHRKDLKTFYPIRRNRKNEYVPLWRAYLFIQFVEGVSIELCRTTSRFIQVISAHDDDGMLRPVLIRRNAIDESLRLITQGKFDDVEFRRRFYGKGSIVRVIDGTFIDKKVRLDEDVFPDWRGNRRVKVDIDGIKGVIEVFKLGL